MKLGGSFEHMLIQGSDAYHRKNLLRVVKVDPPVKHLGKAHANRLIYLENPFLDFIGTWTERGGRMLAFEAKDVNTGTLATKENGNGITPDQIKSLTRWRDAGAATFVLWRSHGETVFLRTETVIQAAGERRGIAPNEGQIVPQGVGFVLVDYLPLLRLAFPP